MLVPAPKAPKLLEREVTRQIRDFMTSHGWRAIRHQRTVVPGQFQSGEPGIPDYSFVYYLPRNKVLGACVLVWIEMKGTHDKRRCNCLQRQVQGKKGKCTNCTQADWRRREESRGAVFAPGNDYSVFETWYSQKFGWLHDGRLPGQLEMFL